LPGGRAQLLLDLRVAVFDLIAVAVQRQPCLQVGVVVAGRDHRVAVLVDQVDALERLAVGVEREDVGDLLPLTRRPKAGSL
jgi:hypothetical protein